MIVVKPAMGFTLPSAGLSPAPSVKIIFSAGAKRLTLAVLRPEDCGGPTRRCRIACRMRRSRFWEARSTPRRRARRLCFRFRCRGASRLLQPVPDLDEDAEGGAGRDEILPFAAPVAFFVDDANAVALELFTGLIEIFQIDRHVMHPLAVARDELADEIVFDLARRALDEFELEAGDLEMSEVEVALGIAGVNFVADFGAGKVARKEIVGGGNVLDRQRDVIEIREAVGRRLGMRLLPVRRVPELDKCAEGRARRDKRCGRA